jgi:hypothetical protein
MERSEHSVCLLTHRIFVPMLDTDCDYRLSYVLSVRFSPPDKKVEKGRGVNWSPRLFSIARRRRHQEPVSVIARLTCEDTDQITTVAYIVGLAHLADEAVDCPNKSFAKNLRRGEMF